MLLTTMRKGAPARDEWFQGQHRFEHWYRDNTVYFITARCREGYAAFESEEAKAVFWDRLGHYANLHGYVPWVTTLMNNHYHTLGYLRRGRELGEMMRKVHGSVAKLVNDLLPEQRVPFWTDRGHHDYFDGCIRDELQCRRAYRYTLRQAVRAKLVREWREYPHTRVSIELDVGVRRALELRAFLHDVPYPRYDRRELPPLEIMGMPDLSVPEVGAPGTGT
jgi:hypothetical protein